MKKISIIVFLSLVLIAPGCSIRQQKTGNAPQETKNQPSHISSQDKTNTTQQKVFTLDELKKYNGLNGTPAYVAVNGVVYDVTNAEKWKNGKHEGVTAGVDLSNAISSSPHGISILNKLPVVGTLK